jgi:hypothetical protein
LIADYPVAELILCLSEEDIEFFQRFAEFMHAQLDELDHDPNKSSRIMIQLSGLSMMSAPTPFAFVS